MISKFITLVIAGSLFTISLSEKDSPVVEAPAGKFLGRILKTRNGKDVHAFQGIPYAKPPVSSLRFKEPVKMPHIEGLFKATDDTKECYQPDLNPSTMKMSGYRGTEDCLILNVYTPKMKNANKLPVFVWIHGGAYNFGSSISKIYGPNYLLDKDMVLVTLNYRLGVLGFLTTGDEVIPGNLGMKDQVLALKWVQENIASFGGDPKSVTLVGESAGGSSVVQHMHSKLSQGLFQKVIAQSGSIDSPWSFKLLDEARDITKQFVNLTGCSLDQNNFLTCMQEIKTANIFEYMDNMKNPFSILQLDFIPVIEQDSSEAFLTESSVNKESNIPLLIGVNSDETIGMLGLMGGVNPKYGQMAGIKEDQDKILPVIGFYQNHPQSDKITKQLLDFYFGPEGIQDNSHKNFVQMLGDLMFVHSVYETTKNHKGKCFMYQFSYNGKASLNQHVPIGLEDGVDHAEDLFFLFNFDLVPHAPLEGQDRAISESMIDLWYNFMKTGNPSTNAIKWEESGNGKRYLDFTKNGLIMKSHFHKERMQFLDSLNLKERVTTRHEEL